MKVLRLTEEQYSALENTLSKRNKALLQEIQQQTRTEETPEALKEYRQQKTESARSAILQAVHDLRTEGEPVNISSTARRAGVSRVTATKYRELLQHGEQGGLLL